MPALIGTGELTIVDIRDGLTIGLSNTNHSVPTDENGENGDYTNCSSTIAILVGSTDDTANWTIQAIPSVGVVGVLNSKTYTVTNMTVDVGTVDFVASRIGFTDLIVRFTISKNRAGKSASQISVVANQKNYITDEGLWGILINDSLQTGQSRGHKLVILDPATDSIVSNTNYDTYAADANVNSLAAAINAVADGMIVILASWDATACNQTLRDALRTCGSDSIEIWTAERRSHAFIGQKGIAVGGAYEKTGTGNTAAGTSKVFAYYGTSGIVKNGSTAVNAISAVLTNDVHSFTALKDGTVSSYAGSGTEIRVYDGTQLLIYDAVGTSIGTWKITTSAQNITVGTITDSGDFATVNNHSAITTDTAIITYTITGKTKLGNSFTLVKSQTFSKSKAGDNAISVILSNEAHSITASNAGVIAAGAYAGSGTEIRVYDGADLLIYDAVGTASGTWKITTSAQNITIGTITDSGDFATVGNQSNMTADTATITYTITGKNKLGISFTATKIQSFSKSKAGDKGDTGTRGTLSLARAITGTSWTDSEALTAITDAGGVSPLPGDVVTLYNVSAGFSQTRIRGASTWNAITGFYGGDVILDNSLSANKIKANSITSDQISAGSISTSKLLVVPESLCPDANFKDISFWSNPWDANGWAVVDSPNSVNTTLGVDRSVYLNTGITTRRHIWSNFINFTGAGRTLRLSAKAANNSGANIIVAARLVRIDNTYSDINVTFPSNGGALASLSNTLVVPNNTVKIQFIVYNAGSGAGGTGQAYVSAIRLEVVASAELIVDGAITADKIAAGAITADNVDTKNLTIKDDAGNIIFSSSTKIGGGNLLFNSSFDYDANNDGIPDGWTSTSIGSGITFERSLVDSTAASGKAFRLNIAALNSPSTATHSIVQTTGNQVQVLPNTTYTLSFMAKTSTLSYKLYNSAFYYAPDGTTAEGSSGVSYEFTAIDTWERVTRKITTTANTKFIRVRFGINRPSTANTTLGSVEVDLMQLEEGDTATSYKPSIFDTVNLSNRLTSTNASTWIENAAIGSAQVGQLTASNIAAGAITADKIGAGAITADKIDAGAITADKIGAGEIVTSKLTVLSNEFVNPVSSTRNLNGWGGISETGVGSVSGLSYNSTENAIQITSSNNHHVHSQSFQVNQNKIYRVTFKIKKSAATGQFYAGLAAYSVFTEGGFDTSNGEGTQSITPYNTSRVAGTALSNAYFQSGTPSTSYVEYVCYIIGSNRNINDCPAHVGSTGNPYMKLSANANWVSLRFLNWANSASTNLFVKDVSVTEVEIGQIVGDNISSNSITTDKIVAGAITADIIDAKGLTITDDDGNIILQAGSTSERRFKGLADPANMIPDILFEDPSWGNSISGDWAATIPTTVLAAKALRYLPTKTAGSTTTFIADETTPSALLAPCYPGETLYISASWATESTATGTWAVIARFYDKNKVALTSSSEPSWKYLTVPQATSTTETWTVTVPANAVYVGYRVRRGATANGGTASGWCEVANIRIVRTQDGATLGAPAGTYVGSTLAETVESRANSVTSKLDKASSEILNVNTTSTTRVAGIRVGDIAWNSSGDRTSGKGVALTPSGMIGHNGTKTTFAINATTGDATFGGTLNVSSASGNARVEITNSSIKVYDENGKLRVHIGDLTQ